MKNRWKKTRPTGSSSTCHPHLRQQTSPSPSPSPGGETPPRGPVYCVTAQQRPRPCVDDLVEIIQDGGWRVDLRVVFVGWFSAMVWGDHGSQEQNLNLSYLPDFYRNTLKWLTKHKQQTQTFNWRYFKKPQSYENSNSLILYPGMVDPPSHHRSLSPSWVAEPNRPTFRRCGRITVASSLPVGGCPRSIIQ